MEQKLSFWEKIEAYRLKNNVIVVVFLIAIFVLSLVLYMLPGVSGNAVLSSLLLAVFTSLLATILGSNAGILGYSITEMKATDKKN